MIRRLRRKLLLALGLFLLLQLAINAVRYQLVMGQLFAYAFELDTFGAKGVRAALARDCARYGIPVRPDEIGIEIVGDGYAVTVPFTWELEIGVDGPGHRTTLRQWAPRSP